jgi:hypothetical protein
MKLFSVIRDFLNEPNSPATVGYGRVMVFGVLTAITVTMALSIGRATQTRFNGVVNVLNFEQDRPEGGGATDRLGL